MYVSFLSNVTVPTSFVQSSKSSRRLTHSAVTLSCRPLSFISFVVCQFYIVICLSAGRAAMLPELPLGSQSVTQSAQAATDSVNPRGATNADIFSELVPSHLVCAICLDAPAGRVEQCPSGHIFCHDPCLARLRQSATRSIAGTADAKCPTCRVDLPESLNRNIVAEQAIAALPAPATCRHCFLAGLEGLRVTLQLIRQR